MAARGGKRPNSGRKLGSTTKKTRAIAEKVLASGQTPLEYMLKIMRDKSMIPMDRFEAAKAAAPYIHPRLAAIEHSGNLAVSHEAALAELDNINDDTAGEDAPT